MALITIPGGFWFPRLPEHSASTPSFTTGDVLDADGEKDAYILRVPRTGTLKAVGFRLGTVTQAPTNGLRVSFQDVSLTTGDPDEATDQFRDVTSGLTTGAWVTTGLITDDGTDTGVKRSVTRGALLAVVVEFASFSAGDNLGVYARASVNTIGSGAVGHAYNTHKTGGTWAKNRGALNLALQYDDDVWECLDLPMHNLAALNSVNFSSSSSPDERGLIFQFPAPVAVRGGWWRGLNTATDTDMVLYDANGTTALETITFDAQVTTTGIGGNASYAPFSQDRVLLANTPYRLVMKPGSSNMTLHDFDVAAAAIMNAHEGGQAWHYTQRTDGGAWSETTTKRPMMGLLVTGIDDGGFRRSAMGRRRTPQTTLVR